MTLRALPRPATEGPGPIGLSRTGEATLRVLCVDDHESIIDGLRARFHATSPLRMVGHLNSVERLIEEAGRLRPDLLVLDIDLPGPDVFETVDRLRHQMPKLRIAFLSGHIREGYLVAARKCGANGYFAKGDPLDETIAGLVEVARGQRDFTAGRSIRERCVTAIGSRRTGGTPSVLESLTPRELEVLRLIGRGRSRREIAGELCRSPKTIDGHQDRLMRKLGLETRTDLVRFAIREGFAEA
jgi:DNA-binding NarL/FixJ family response regulator